MISVDSQQWKVNDLAAWHSEFGQVSGVFMAKSIPEHSGNDSPVGIRGNDTVSFLAPEVGALSVG